MKKGGFFLSLENKEHNLRNFLKTIKPKKKRKWSDYRRLSGVVQTVWLYIRGGPAHGRKERTS